MMIARMLSYSQDKAQQMGSIIRTLESVRRHQPIRCQRGRLMMLVMGNLQKTVTKEKISQ